EKGPRHAELGLGPELGEVAADNDEVGVLRTKIGHQPVGKMGVMVPEMQVGQMADPHRQASSTSIATAGAASATGGASTSRAKGSDLNDSGPSSIPPSPSSITRTRRRRVRITSDRTFSI